MARVEIAPEVEEDLDRIFDHVTRHEARNVPSQIHGIIQAIAVLEQNPLIGRPVEGDRRELIIGRRDQGYVALYVYEAVVDTVFVLAIRAQREAGYRG